MLVEEYAIQIARDWNTKNGAIGYVTEFDVEETFLSKYPVQTVGTRDLHLELWVPAEELDDLNAHIVGGIRVTHAYRGVPRRSVTATPFAARWT